MNIAVSVVAGAAGLFALRKYLTGGVCTSKVQLPDKIVIVTGANTGIGLETCKDLSKRGAIIIMACRNVQLAKDAAEIVSSFSGNDKVDVMELDLASLESVRSFAANFKKKYDRLDILINNAGVMACPKAFTKDGIEMQFGVNHIGHFLLTNLLLDYLKKSAPSRIINVSSLAHQRGKIHFDDINLDKCYSPFESYSQSKLANVLFTRELARRLEGSGVPVVSVHPGAVQTELVRHMNFLVQKFLVPAAWFFMKRPWQGAQTSIHCAVDEQIPKHSGSYFSDCAVKGTSKLGENMDDAKRLWELSENLVGQSFS